MDSSASLARIQLDLDPVNIRTFSQDRSHCCTRCWSASKSWMTSGMGITFLLLVYLVAGSILFMLLGSENQSKRSSPPVLSSSEDPLSSYDPDGKLLQQTLATVDRLWSITEDLNILYRDNWTQLASTELRYYQDQLVRTIRKTILDERYSYQQSWTFSMAFLYSLSLITTIGYGFYFPHTILMKILTLMYSVIGIPLFLLFLSISGDRVAAMIGGINQYLCCCFYRRKRQLSSHDVSLPLQSTTVNQRINGHAIQIEQDQDHSHEVPTRNNSQVPLLLSVLVLTSYVLLGGVAYVLLEGISFSDGVYLSASLLLTLGFATLLPGMNGESSPKNTSQLSLLVIALYVIFGMSLVASFFNISVDFYTTIKRNRRKRKLQN